MCHDGSISLHFSEFLCSFLHFSSLLYISLHVLYYAHMVVYNSWLLNLTPGDDCNCSGTLPWSFPFPLHFPSKVFTEILVVVIFAQSEGDCQSKRPAAGTQKNFLTEINQSPWLGKNFIRNRDEIVKLRIGCHAFYIWRSVRMSLGICPGVSSKFWRVVGSFKSR